MVLMVSVVLNTAFQATVGSVADMYTTDASTTPQHSPYLLASPPRTLFYGLRGSVVGCLRAALTRAAHESDAITARFVFLPHMPHSAQQKFGLSMHASCVGRQQGTGLQWSFHLTQTWSFCGKRLCLVPGCWII